MAADGVRAEALRIVASTFDSRDVKPDLLTLFKLCTEIAAKTVAAEQAAAKAAESEAKAEAKVAAQVVARLEREEAARAALEAKTAAAKAKAAAAEAKQTAKAQKEEEDRRQHVEKVAEKEKEKAEMEEEERKRRAAEEEKRDTRSSATNISKDRLERSSKRLSTFKSAAVAAGGNGGSKQIVDASLTAAIKEWKPDPRAPKLAEDWRGGATSAQRMDTCVCWPPEGDFAFADCLAADENDTIVCQGSDGEASTLSTYSALHGADLCLLGHADAICSIASKTSRLELARRLVRSGWPCSLRLSAL